MRKFYYNTPGGNPEFPQCVLADTMIIHPSGALVFREGSDGLVLAVSPNGWLDVWYEEEDGDGE